MREDVRRVRAAAERALVEAKNCALHQSTRGCCTQFENFMQQHQSPRSPVQHRTSVRKTSRAVALLCGNLSFECLDLTLDLCDA